MVMRRAARFQQDHTACCVESRWKGARWKQVDKEWIVLVITQGRDDGAWSRVMEIMLMRSGWLLQIELQGPAVGPDVGSKRKRGVRNDSEVNKWRELPFCTMEKLEEELLGRGM